MSEPVKGHPQWSWGNRQRNAKGELVIEIFPTVNRPVVEYGWSHRPGAYVVQGESFADCERQAIEWIEAGAHYPKQSFS